ncbi:MAG: ATP-binding protein [Legionellales bacterium]|jgi:hypothetical protein
MQRPQSKPIKHDLEQKIVLLSGPRQCGKTTLSKQLFDQYDYFNYDFIDDRLALKEMSWDRQKPLVIFDELHKMKNWKQWLKGIYDKQGVRPRLLVTGSAKLDTYKKTGDSLAGRFFQHRLHPLDLKEAWHYWQQDGEEIFQRLFHCGGFPEPFLKGSEEYYKRWRRTHLDIILRQDLIDLEAVRDIQGIEVLITLLKTRVGQCVSYANLARDLERDPTTVKRWLQLLENLYIIFKVSPYHSNIARSLLKEPKYFFYDIGQVASNEGNKLENLVACSLLKELQLLEDLTGAQTGLHYLRTKDGKELDFLVVINDKPCYLIEGKWSDDKPANGFKYFRSYFPEAKAVQLVKNISREKTFADGLEIRNVVSWLCQLDLRQD